MTATSPQAAAHKPRMAYVDNLRVFLTALVVCHHVAIGLGGPGLWYFTVPSPADPLTTLVLAMFVAVNQAYFMSLFFAVSAYFTPVSFDRKGVLRFLLDRLFRLGLPLLIFVLVLNPAIVFLSRRLNDQAFPDRWLDAAGSGPLWFVLTLLLFSVMYAVLRLVSRSPVVSRAFPSHRWLLGFAVTMGLTAFAVRLRFPIGTTVMNLQLGFFPLYVCLFCGGIQACRNQWFDQLTIEHVRPWWRAALVCICLFPFIMAAMQFSGALDGGLDVVNGGPHWQALVFAMWEPFVCLGVSLKLIVLFRERFSNTSGTTRWMSASAYTVYIVHPFFVIITTWLLMDLPLPRLLLFSLICVISVTTCFAAANLIRRFPLISRVV